MGSSFTIMIVFRLKLSLFTNDTMDDLIKKDEKQNRKPNSAAAMGTPYLVKCWETFAIMKVYFNVTTYNLQKYFMFVITTLVRL